MSTEHAPATAIRLSLLSVIACAVAACAWGAPSLSAVSSPVSTPATPNSCIALNGGDYNACNVGNSGRGDLLYRHVGN